MSANLNPEFSAQVNPESAPDFTADFSAAFSGRLKLPTSIPELGRTYKSASPFPHLVMDNLFAPHLLDALPVEMNTLPRERWVRIDNESLQKVDRMRSGMDMDSAATQLTNILHSPAFLYLLSEITGVWQLLPDPYLQGAGYASMRRGDYFQVHSDRSVAYDTGLDRRLAMIVFLNKTWKKEYHGELELWDAEAKGPEISIDPVFNRTVLFEVAYPNFHGVPTPLACPTDLTRQSFIVYYHTSGKPENSTVKPHTSLFAPGIYRKKKTPLHSLMSELTPPALMKAVKKLM